MINEDYSDENIVRSVLRGNIADFSIIVDRYKDRIYSIGYRFFYNRSDAEDFTQDLFIRVFEKLSTFRFNSAFRYWLVKIAYNSGINQKKKRVIVGESLEYEAMDSTRGFEHEAIKEEIVTLLNKSVQKLPENYRICIDLYFYWNLQYENIKEITGIPVNTIKSNVLRAKTILRDSLRGTIAEEYYEV